MNNQALIDLAKKYANSFQWCFTNESSESFKKKFAKKRLETTVEEIELESCELKECDRNKRKVSTLFIDEFIKEIDVILKERSKQIKHKSKEEK